jgi:hypothetical protein
MGPQNDETDYSDGAVVTPAPSFLLDSLLWMEYFLTAARNGSLAPVGRTLPPKISANGTKLPYSKRVSSLS